MQNMQSSIYSYIWCNY